MIGKGRGMSKFEIGDVVYWEEYGNVAIVMDGFSFDNVRSEVYIPCVFGMSINVITWVKRTDLILISKGDFK